MLGDSCRLNSLQHFKGVPMLLPSYYSSSPPPRPTSASQLRTVSPSERPTRQRATTVNQPPRYIQQQGMRRLLLFIYAMQDKIKYCVVVHLRISAWTTISPSTRIQDTSCCSVTMIYPSDTTLLLTLSLQKPRTITIHKNCLVCAC